MGTLITPCIRMVQPDMATLFNGQDIVYDVPAYAYGRQSPWRSGQGSGSPFRYLADPNIPIVSEDVYTQDDRGHTFPAGTKWLCCHRCKIGTGDFTDPADYEPIWVPVPESLPSGWEELGRMLYPSTSVWKQTTSSRNTSLWQQHSFAGFVNVRTSETDAIATRRNNFSAIVPASIMSVGSTVYDNQIPIRRPGGGGVWQTPARHISPCCWNDRAWRWRHSDWTYSLPSGEPSQFFRASESLIAVGFREVSWQIDVDVIIEEGVGYDSHVFTDSVAATTLSLLRNSPSATYVTIDLGTPTLINTTSDGTYTTKTYRFTGSSTNSALSPAIASSMSPSGTEIIEWTGMTWRLELESVGTYWTDLTGSGAFDENTLNYVEVKYTSINLYAGGRIDIPYWFAATGAGVHIPGGVPSGFWAAL